jgi:hypothetical protein
LPYFLAWRLLQYVISRKIHVKITFSPKGWFTHIMPCRCRAVRC